MSAVGLDDAIAGRASTCLRCSAGPSHFYCRAPRVKECPTGSRMVSVVDRLMADEPEEVDDLRLQLIEALIEEARRG